MKAWIAAALIVVPVIIVVAIAVWPGTPIDASSVVFLPTKVYGLTAGEDLTEMIPAVLASHLKEIPGLDVRISSTESADVAVLSTLTSDSGILQLNIQIIDTRTRKEVWGNSYQSPSGQYSEMLRVAGEGLRGVLD